MSTTFRQLVYFVPRLPEAQRCQLVLVVKMAFDACIQSYDALFQWFGFYKPGQGKELYTLQQSPLFLEVLC